MSETKKGSWYETGYSGVGREAARIESMHGPNRFWMPENSKKQIVFIDDEPACIHEHNPKLNGSWKNWLTCLQGVADDVPCCEILGANTRGYVGFFTVIDCTEWVDKKGNKYQYEIKLFPAKLKTLKKFAMKKEDRGSLVGALYTVVRTDSKSPSCGDDFEFIREADLTKLFQVANYKGKKLPELYSKLGDNPENMERMKAVFQLQLDDKGVVVPKIVPFNYYEVLKPKSPKEIREMLRGAKVDSGGGGGEGDDGDKATGGADEAVPF